ncbi:hypothetical protein OG874_28960 [Nocardia sp. NBC_00565]|nr:hypothetical protein [Nocardia sp. NBC_00565]WUC00855.1 hypothetical protein OG874_28960 [Nocardia sp. NBC_00565]
MQAFLGLYVRRYDVADDPRIEHTALKSGSAKWFRRFGTGESTKTGSGE